MLVIFWLGLIIAHDLAEETLKLMKLLVLSLIPSPPFFMAIQDNLSSSSTISNRDYTEFSGRG